MMDQRIIRKPELMQKVGLSDSTIWRMEKKGDFPKRLQIGGNAVGWLSDEIDRWLASKAEQRKR